MKRIVVSSEDVVTLKLKTVTMLKVIIVDDEQSAITSLLWELDHFKNDVEVLATFINPEEAIVFANDEKLDAIFLDIQMHHYTGFDFIEGLLKPLPAIIFTTAHDQYALDAIKINVLDYLTKPIDTDDLAAAIEKLKNIVTQKSVKGIEYFMSQLERSPNNKKIGLQSDGKIIFIEADQIFYIESDGNYSTIYYDSGKKLLVTKKLKEVQELLSGHDFFRIHNSYVINLNKIKEYYKSESYVVLDNDAKLPVSRQKKTDFLNQI